MIRVWSHNSKGNPSWTLGSHGEQLVEEDGAHFVKAEIADEVKGTVGNVTNERAERCTQPYSKNLSKERAERCKQQNSQKSGGERAERCMQQYSQLEKQSLCERVDAVVQLLVAADAAPCEPSRD